MTRVAGRLGAPSAYAVWSGKPRTVAGTRHCQATLWQLFRPLSSGAPFTLRGDLNNEVVVIPLIALAIRPDPDHSMTSAMEVSAARGCRDVAILQWTVRLDALVPVATALLLVLPTSRLQMEAGWATRLGSPSHLRSPIRYLRELGSERHTRRWRVNCSSAHAAQVGLSNIRPRERCWDGGLPGQR